MEETKKTKKELLIEERNFLTKTQERLVLLQDKRHLCLKEHARYYEELENYQSNYAYFSKKKEKIQKEKHVKNFLVYASGLFLVQAPLLFITGEPHVLIAGYMIGVSLCVGKRYATFKKKQGPKLLQDYTCRLQNYEEAITEIKKEMAYCQVHEGKLAVEISEVQKLVDQKEKYVTALAEDVRYESSVPYEPSPKVKVYTLPKESL